MSVRGKTGRWLRRHGWESCDNCRCSRPRRWAWNHGWMLGGVAGWFDLCPNCEAPGLHDEAAS